ncbi:hypothetical protein K9N68_27210 [Kovacikia minuta CCNUW1]|uniref:hypothetical protein n=1 Tax=Kovacikia minuta TaxID=2931930 RepID=UPI001CCB7146|nr:hypothetical protein [Kovacikia minuta]UBF25268.1 hypothetical protein K9N68_27210 [Kovacikia minuta CCNUW1]
MATPELKPDDSISSLTFAELETLITHIVRKAIQQKQSPYEAEMERIRQELKKPYDPTAPSLADIALELAAKVPEEEWARVPKDASKRYKEYLYGRPQSQE